MQKIRLLLMIATLAMLAACAVVQGEAPTLFDLGPHRDTRTDATLQGKAVSVADIRVPAWLDSELMYFRLNYAQRQQPRPYATTRWTMTPGQLLSQRVNQRIAAAGGIALSAADGASHAPTLRIALDDFSQHFTAPGASVGRVSLRATLFDGRKVIGQRTFNQEVAAPSADAAGGAQALAAATDAVLSDLIAWLSSLN